ncbi:hypothetical protein GTHT12_03416 [Geobacillus thermodenitrificans]|jgi:hypothetical protein|nr:hypothetical protein GTHT12_03416 [Geobacillus thermodenitrificans]KQB94769.1 hypothetical protein GEPA3_0294 [Geobacillus sp. PA-3]MEC5189415.1 hypothetical protein [Geobacillus thermodenitrificans]
MRLSSSMTPTAKCRTGWSSLCVRPIDVGDRMVFHPPFRCFARMRANLSNAWLSMTIHHQGGEELWT